MQVIERIEDIKDMPASAVAVGTFDGIHIGHMQVLKAAIEAQGLSPSVFTFAQNPAGQPAIYLKEEKLYWLKKIGIETVFCVDFVALRHMNATAFILDILSKRCNARLICCGPDYRFGKNARGNARLLAETCASSNISLNVTPYTEMENEKVSSTKIRQLLKAGDIIMANKLLGRPYGFSLEVIHGNHLGSGLGMPTINQALPEGMLQPKFGVYASFVKIDGKYHFGVTNIGVKPTVGSAYVLSETWMPGFSGDLYGRRLRVFLFRFLRDEKKFLSLEEMKRTVYRDADMARILLDDGEIMAQMAELYPRDLV